MNKPLEGIIAPITTPFENEEVDLGGLRENVRKYARTGLSGLFVLGSNGENKSLSDGEKWSILETVLDAHSPDQMVVAGAGYESTKLTVDFARQAARMGADYVSVLTPSYYKKRLTDEAFIRYFKDVADAVPVPVLIYNVPGHTGVTLSVKVVEAVAGHPNIAGMKDVAPGMFVQYLEAAAGRIAILSGTLDSILPALLLGAVGGVLSLANAFPEACCDLYRRVQANDMAGAREIYMKLLRLNRSVSGSLGVAGVKAAMELNGYCGGDPRLPLLPLTPQERESLRHAVITAGVI